MFMYFKVADWIHLDTSKSAEIDRQCKTKSYKLLLSFNNTSLFFGPDLVCLGLGLNSLWSW